MRERAAPRIKLGGVFLDEVRTQIEQARIEETRVAHSVMFMAMPATRHSFEIEGDGAAVTIKSPALTLMQLSFDGVISSTQGTRGTRTVDLLIEGHIEGTFVVEWLRRVEGFEFGEPMLLRLRRCPTS